MDSNSPGLVDIWKKQFRDLDIRKQGQINRRLMSQLLENEGDELDRLMVILLFEQYDSNHDDQIDSDDFVRFCADMRPLSDQEILRRVFDLVDANHDGKLDLSEVEQMGLLMGLKVDRLDAWATVSVLDTNCDRLVDFNEFCALLA
jgi:Ca2+-binding EF-hand superfamily protein